MQKNKLWLLISLQIAVLCAFLFYYFLLPAETYKYSASADISAKKNEIGFDATNTSLNFGILPAGTSATRQIDIRTGKPMRIAIKSSGPVKKFLKVSKNNFILNGAETITISLSVPKGAAPGHLEGNVDVLVYRAIRF